MRIRSLDSLRGLAAGAVVLDHWRLTFHEANPFSAKQFDVEMQYGPIAFIGRAFSHLLTPGAAAVLIFFVLSGFVLSLSMDKQKENYARFIVRRFLRIYPAFAFAILFSIVLFLAVDPHPIPQLTDWFALSWREQPRLGLVAAHLAMIGSSRFESLDNVMWSLVHELRISMVFPLIVYFVRRSLWTALFLSFCASVLARVGADFAPPLIADALMTVYYTFLFFAGCALAENIVVVKHFIQSRTAIFRLGLWGVTIASLLMPDMALGGGWDVCTKGPGAIGVVALSFSDLNAVRVLEHRFLRYFGRISYSLYLVHLPIILALVHTFYGKMPTWVLIAGGSIIMIVTADVANRLIERPCQKLSHFLGNRRRLGYAAPDVSRNVGDGAGISG